MPTLQELGRQAAQGMRKRAWPNGSGMSAALGNQPPPNPWMPGMGQGLMRSHHEQSGQELQGLLTHLQNSEPGILSAMGLQAGKRIPNPGPYPQSGAMMSYPDPGSAGQGLTGGAMTRPPTMPTPMPYEGADGGSLNPFQN